MVGANPFLMCNSQLLGDLEDRIQSLGEGSRSMATQVTLLSGGFMTLRLTF
jgi:hypothetical protein